MKVVKNYPDGIFNWVDLGTTDVAGAIAFYTGLFGWEANPVPLPGGGEYTTMKLNGYTVAGAGQLDPDMQQRGVPPHWSSYIKHDAADSVAAKAAAAGGTVLLPPMDIMNEGRMTMIQDPTGAVFGVWQPKEHIGAQLVNNPNTLVWNELQTRDAAGAKSFYKSVFGWEYSVDPNGYVLCQLAERTHAGMMQMDENWDANIPATWAVYFMVENLEAGTEKASQLGGHMVVPPTSAGEMGKFSVIADPQGAIFTIMQFDGPVDDPPGI